MALLIEAGAKVEAVLPPSSSVKHNSVTSPLHIAAQQGNVEAVRLLISAGASKERKNSDGQTPLIAAAENGHANVVRLLVDTGASIDASQQDGMTAVSQAVGGGHIETLKILVDAGADVHKVFQSHVQDTGTSPIHVAAYTGNTEAIEILLQRVLTLMYP
eukprot:m.312832 g.312832  ORF g.312832 m.312832 type:complete len:160 (+) comp16405_c0_seq14:318-797(+)